MDQGNYEYLLGVGAQFNRNQHRAATNMSVKNHHLGVTYAKTSSSTGNMTPSSGTGAGENKKQTEANSDSQQDRNGYNAVERWYHEHISGQPWNGLIWQETTNKK